MFKMLPVVGGWVQKLVQEGNQSIARWRWKDAKGNNGKWEGDVSWRLGETREFADIKKMSKL